MKEKVSIIVPVYNTRNYLKKCLDSIISQTYKNIEIILIDDGSTDGSGNICDEYVKKDKRIIVLHKDNQGVSVARNDGLNICTGEFIMFIDSDDYITTDCILNMMKLFNTNIDMSICEMSNIMPDGNIIKSVRSFEKDIMDSRKDYAKNLHSWGPMCKLFRTELVNNIRFPRVAISEDLDFLSRVLCENESFTIAYTDENLYYYRIIHTSAMNQRYTKKFYESVRTQEKVLERFRDNTINIENSEILKNAVEVFLYKYFNLSKEEQKKNKNDYKNVRTIIKRNKTYIINKTNVDNITFIKRLIFAYCPKIYGMYILQKIDRG